MGTDVADVEFAFPPAERGTHMGGPHVQFKFPNGYGASVVCHWGSYGGPEGLWELAVLGPDGRLAYDTPVTSDVLGNLDIESVNEALRQIEALPATKETA